MPNDLNLILYKHFGMIYKGGQKMHKSSELLNELREVFQPKKIYSLKYSKVLERIGETKRASRVKDCGSYLEFGLYDDETVRLSHANFCSDSLCPQCAKRKSLKLFSQVSAVTDKLQNEYVFLFVTLTVQNSIGDDLGSNCDLLYKSYQRLVDLKRFKFIKGAFRALEITVNRDTMPITYHPHLHCIWVVEKSYFDNQYLTQKELSEYWGRALGVDYVPIVDIRRCKGKGFTKNGKVYVKSVKSAVAEVAKYSVKSSDYLAGTDEQNNEVVKTLLSVLRNRRMFIFTGVMRSVRQELKLDDIENGDLVHVEAEDLAPAVLVARLFFRWCSKSSEYVHTGLMLVYDDDLPECV